MKPRNGMSYRNFFSRWMDGRIRFPKHHNNETRDDLLSQVISSSVHLRTRHSIDYHKSQSERVDGQSPSDLSVLLTLKNTIVTPSSADVLLDSLQKLSQIASCFLFSLFSHSRNLHCSQNLFVSSVPKS